MRPAQTDAPDALTHPQLVAERSIRDKNLRCDPVSKERREGDDAVGTAEEEAVQGPKDVPAQRLEHGDLRRRSR